MGERAEKRSGKMGLPDTMGVNEEEEKIWWELGGNGSVVVRGVAERVWEKLGGGGRKKNRWDGGRWYWEWGEVREERQETGGVGGEERGETKK